VGGSVGKYVFHNFLSEVTSESDKFSLQILPVAQEFLMLQYWTTSSLMHNFTI
jgi:hypothetical protein